MERTSVLVVGGGLVGLSAALFLQYHGVDFILVERRSGASVLPRSRGVHTRTVEMFRQVGVEDVVQQAAATALAAGSFGGARTGPTLLESASLDMSGVRMAMGGDPSPSHFCFCPQVLLEPVLTHLARERGGDLRFGTEVTALAPDRDGVTATVGDTTIRAGYVVAADGAAGGIRAMLGISAWTLPPRHRYLNAFVHADLTDLVAGRTFSQCEITGDRARGVILAKNNTTEWSFHFEYDDTPPDNIAELVRAAVGRDDLDVRVLASSTWDDRVQVADDYRRGRVFLTGDAAHQHAPWGGFGANTGIADAHNLAWKLASVLAGQAGPGLLDTYQPERRPRAVLAAEQARLRTDFLARYGVVTPDNAADVARHVDTGAIMTRYNYTDGGVVDELTGQVGTRIPHVQLSSGVSTLDLSGPGFAILAGPDSPDWPGVKVHRIGNDTDLLDRTGLGPEGALLVRPDQHVAARTDAGLRPDNLTAVLRDLTDG